MRDILVVPFVPETRVPGLEQPIILTSGDKPVVDVAGVGAEELRSALQSFRIQGSGGVVEATGTDSMPRAKLGVFQEKMSSTSDPAAG